tara:strand:- start:30 stop:686 length:657 start_codon:yes stop_codon:yes gene_type:complete
MTTNTTTTEKQIGHNGRAVTKPKKIKNFYAVKTTTEDIVYSSWDECKTFVQNTGGKFKGFDSKIDAEDWLDGKVFKVDTKVKKKVTVPKTKKVKNTVTVAKTKTTEATAVRKTIETTRVRTQFKDVIGEVKREGEFTFAQSYDKVAEGFVRIVKYADTTIKVFDKNGFEVSPAKPTICRAVAILDNFDETQLSVYAKKSTTRSSGARLLKLLGDKLKE